MRQQLLEFVESGTNRINNLISELLHTAPTTAVFLHCFFFTLPNTAHMHCIRYSWPFYDLDTTLSFLTLRQTHSTIIHFSQ